MTVREKGSRALVCSALAAFLTIAVVGHAVAASQLDWSNCLAVQPDRKIAGCTRILQDQGQKPGSRAIAYYNRGRAHFGKGDLSLAIADYNEAIRLETGYVAAYEARGRAWSDKGEFARSIADFDEVIRRNPHLSSAYNSRGIAWRAKGDLNRAIEDYDEALRLDSKSSIPYNNRAIAWRAKGDIDRAMADFNEAIRLDPKFALAYVNRGVASYYGGYVARAQVDFLHASDLNPKDAYAALWLDLTLRRSMIPSQLSKAARHLDMKAWPAPIIRLFLGEMTPAAVIAATHGRDPITRRAQVCEANLFSGALALLQGSKEQALPLLQRAASDCPRTFVEWEAANAELRALGAAP